MPAAADAPDATYDAYFISEKGTHTATFKDGEVFQYGVSAADPGVRDLIFYLKSGTAVTPDGVIGSSNTIRLQGMQDGLGAVTDGLMDSKKILGEQLGKLEGISKRNDEDVAYLTQTMSELTDADLLAEFIRSTQEMLKLNMNQTLLAKENETLKNLLSNI
jgi:flagellin-like hook-associated protein FlgL